MHREDDSRYLLFIEPTLGYKSKEPVEDEWTIMLAAEMAGARRGTSGHDNRDDFGSFVEGESYGETHTTDCGESSGDQDLLLANDLITNSLALFYMRWYRDAIPASEWKKLKHLAQFHEARKIVHAHGLGKK